MDLLHVDFMSIEMTTEPNRLLKVANILVFQDHFTNHIMAYTTPDQTAKTIAKFLYQGYILIFGALARLLSDHRTNFMSNIISEMCKLLGMKKMCTMPYYPQTNRLVERSHQTIMHMIVKLGEDKKADWPNHLAEIVQAFVLGTLSVIVLTCPLLDKGAWDTLSFIYTKVCGQSGPSSANYRSLWATSSRVWR